MRKCIILAVLLVLSASCARAHTMTMTQVLVSFGQLNTVDVRIDIDPTLLLGSPERYYELATEPAQKQQRELGAIVPKIIDSFRLFVGAERLQLEFHGFAPAKASKADFLDSSFSKLSTLTF